MNKIKLDMESMRERCE